MAWSPSDDLSMKALSGDFAERARASREAGCDVVLHCNGGMSEMKAVVEGAGDLKGKAAARAKAAMARLAKVPEPFDAVEGQVAVRRGFRRKVRGMSGTFQPTLDFAAAATAARGRRGADCRYRRL